MDRTDQKLADDTETAPALPVHTEGCTIEDYRLIARVGEGTYGEVWKAERNGFPVALKIIKSSMNSEETQRELKSLAILKTLSHKFLLHTGNFWSDGDRLFIEMELADGGTLKERLRAYQALGKAGIPEDEMLKFFTEAGKALDYLHGHRPVFLHRDIKPANVLLARGNAKIADFGLLRQITGDNTSTKTQGGTPVYMAPESITEDRFSVLTDLFSFAVTYVECRQGRLPFAAKNQFQIFQKICKDPPDLSDIFHPEERRVLLKALAKEPENRFPSCGDFVFELNRVVPWVPAVEIPALAMPAYQEGGTPFFTARSPTADSKESVPNTLRRRAQPTRPDIELPPTAPEVAREDGTLHDHGKRSAKPAAEPVVLEADAEDEAHSIAPKPGSATATIGKETQPKSAPISAPAAPEPAKAPQQKNVVKIVVAAVVAVAVIAGAGFLFTMGRHPDPGNAKSGNDTSGKTPKDDAGARKDGESNAAAFLRQADDLRKTGDFKSCLNMLAETKLDFTGEDLARRDRIREQARNGEQARLIDEVRTELKARPPQHVAEKLAALKKFRQDNGIPADQAPSFKELSYPADLLTRAWQPLLADKVDVKQARARLDEVKAYTIQPDTLVLDPRYDGNLAALEALVKAYESGTEDSCAQLLSVLRGTTDPDCSRDLWLSLAPLENSKPAFRFANLDALPASPDDAACRKARLQFVVAVLDRLVQENNYQWFPSKEEAAKCRSWLSDYDGPDVAVRALKAECRVRLGDNLQEIKAVVLPAKADWFVFYAVALVLNANHKPADAAAMLVTGLKGNAKVRKERVQDGLPILRSAVATLQPKAPATRVFSSREDAAQALDWLALMLDLGQKQTQITVDDLINLAFAGVKAESADADDLLQKAANRLDLRSPADQTTGYRGFAQAYLDDVAAANSTLQKAADWERALKKSARAEEFALRLRKANLPKEAAELNRDAVVLQANTAFAKAADDKGKAKFRVFEAAIDKAKKLDQPDGLVLPVVVAALESAGEFSKNDLQQAINEGDLALDPKKLPSGSWWETLRYRGLARLADAKLGLFFNFNNGAAQEKSVVKKEYEGALKLYQEAKAPALKNVEKFQGELAFKIGVFQFLLGEYKDAYQNLTEARTKINEIPPAERGAEIRDALTQIGTLLNDEKLKPFSSDK